MDGKYIFAIVILGLFFLLILVSFAFLEYARVKNKKLQAWINERRENSETCGSDYDNFAEEDMPAVQAVQDASLNDIESAEENDGEVLQNIEDSFGKIDLEGIEEITGNYSEDK